MRATRSVRRCSNSSPHGGLMRTPLDMLVAAARLVFSATPCSGTVQPCTASTHPPPAAELAAAPVPCAGNRIVPRFSRGRGKPASKPEPLRRDSAALRRMAQTRQRALSRYTSSQRRAVRRLSSGETTWCSHRAAVAARPAVINEFFTDSACAPRSRASWPSVEQSRTVSRGNRVCASAWERTRASRDRWAQPFKLVAN